MSNKLIKKTFSTLHLPSQKYEAEARASIQYVVQNEPWGAAKQQTFSFYVYVLLCFLFMCTIYMCSVCPPVAKLTDTRAHAHTQFHADQRTSKMKRKGRKHRKEEKQRRGKSVSYSLCKRYFIFITLSGLILPTVVNFAKQLDL